MINFRSPSTPSASRPHTPQTPSPYVPGGGGAPAPQGQPPMQMMMPAYMVSSQPTYQQAPHTPNNRMRKGMLCKDLILFIHSKLILSI